MVGAGVTGYKMWNRYKEGEISQKEIVTSVLKQSVLFGGVAAASTFVGGGGGGGAGIAAMSVIGLGGTGGGGGKGRGDLFSGLLLDALEESPKAKPRGRRGQRGELLRELEEEIEETLDEEP